MNNGFNSGNFKTAMFADCLANSKEIFQLIDQVFPLDSCRHYEVLPLKLEGSKLALGMLNPNQDESVRFVNSIAKVFKYELEIQLIDLQTHQIILDNYPQNATQSNRQQQDENKTIIDTSFNPNAPLKGVNYRRLVDSTPTIISSAAAAPIEEPELELPDLPADLDFLKNLELAPKEQPTAPRAKPDSAATLFEIPAEFRQGNSLNNLNDQDQKATIIADYPAKLLESETKEEQDLEGILTEAQISQLIAETLGKTSVSEELEPATADFLPQLSPQLSWQKLLDQAFQHQTEYITLTRYSDRGGIVAEKNNSPQSTLDRVPLPIFCSLIDEIKRMARLPQNTSSHPQKLVLERLYEQERILLRLEFSVYQQLEAVKIQILRGQALKMYEQQQMDRVCDQALQLAKQLEKTLRRIQACFDSAEFTNLKELQSINGRINHQLRLLDK
jgi:Type II secretion system (T2SS), protein E, N-terminal domain